MTTVAVPANRAGTRRRGAPGAAPREEPWGRRTLAVTAVLSALGVLGIVLGWFGISGTVDLDAQARWLALGIAGLIVAGVGMVSWLLVGLVAVATLRREVLTALASRPEDPGAGAGTAAGLDTAEVSLGFGTVPGQRRYHRPECPLLARKQARFARLDEHAAAGRQPCGVCRPPEGESVP